MLLYFAADKAQKLRKWKQNKKPITGGTQTQLISIFTDSLQLIMDCTATAITTTLHHLTASSPGQPRQAGIRKVKPVWI